MRDLLKQKQRVWQVFRRAKLLTENERKNEQISLTDSWITQLKQEMSKCAMDVVEKQQRHRKCGEQGEGDHKAATATEELQHQA
jgi:hypothetical protein